MQPFVNPNFYQQYTQPVPYANPYYPAGMQTQGTISGRMVDGLESISANDVPMQGYSIFPKSDMSVIYAKSWQPNGTIKTITYKPYVEAPEPDAALAGADKTFESILGGIDLEIKSLHDDIVAMAERIDKISAKQKKEG